MIKRVDLAWLSGRVGVKKRCMQQVQVGRLLELELQIRTLAVAGSLHPNGRDQAGGLRSDLISLKRWSGV